MAAERWLFSRSKLENTPSRRCGIDSDKELNYRQHTANFIQEMGQKLQVYPSLSNEFKYRGHRVFPFISESHWKSFGMLLNFMLFRHFYCLEIYSVESRDVHIQSGHQFNGTDDKVLEVFTFKVVVVNGADPTGNKPDVNMATTILCRHFCHGGYHMSSTSFLCNSVTFQVSIIIKNKTTRSCMNGILFRFPVNVIEASEETSPIF